MHRSHTETHTKSFSALSYGRNVRNIQWTLMVKQLARKSFFVRVLLVVGCWLLVVGCVWLVVRLVARLVCWLWWLWWLWFRPCVYVTCLSMPHDVVVVVVVVVLVVVVVVPVVVVVVVVPVVRVLCVVCVWCALASGVPATPSPP